MAVSDIINSIVSSLDSQIMAITPQGDFDSRRLQLLKMRTDILLGLPNTGGVTSSNATVASIPASSISTLLLSANPQRRGALFFNNASTVLFLKCGAGASAASFTVKIPPQVFWELSFAYIGTIYGAWETGGGAVLVTELS